MLLCTLASQAGTVSCHGFKPSRDWEGPHSLDSGHCPWFILRRQGCRIDLSYEKGASVSELVSSSKQDSRVEGIFFFSLCVHPKPVPWARALPTSLFWSRPWTETHHNKDWHREQISPEAVVLAMEAKTFFYKPSDLSGFNSLLESAFPGILFSAITYVKGCSPWRDLCEREGILFIWLPWPPSWFQGR